MMPPRMQQNSPDQEVRTGGMQALQVLLDEAVNAWPQFDDDAPEVNGGDMVEWFGWWRERVKAVLRRGHRQ